MQVLWAKQSVREDADLFEVGEQRENVDGDSLSFLIPNLEPDTSYRVQVRESSLLFALSNSSHVLLLSVRRSKQSRSMATRS